MLNINNEPIAYMIGLIQSDGSVSEEDRNRGKIRIELNKNDSNILIKLYNLISSFGIHCGLNERTRDTQFKHDYKSVILSVYNLEFREFVSRYVPIGYKSHKVAFPDGLDSVNTRHYIRGFIDGDGSVGLKRDGSPFISLWSVNESIMRSFEEYFFKLTGVHRTLNPTARDNGYSLMYSNEEAQIIIRELYTDCNLYIDRKYNNALNALKWKRPDGKKKIKRQVWDAEQDNFILTHSIEESIEYLDRTEKSIKSRLFRLKH